MPTVRSSQLQVNQPIEASAPDAALTITIDPASPVRVGSLTFQLEVVDDAGNRSQPVQARVVIMDNQAPTAVITAPRAVPFGTQFTLSGAESRDVGGAIAKYIWTLVG
jgi:hypothetical protein